MDAGELRDRLRFERRATIADTGMGVVEGDWEQVYPVAETGLKSVAARIKPLRATEQVLQRRLEGTVDYAIRIRWSRVAATLGSECRAVNVRSGAHYNLTSFLDPDGGREWLDITATLGGADG